MQCVVQEGFQFILHKRKIEDPSREAMGDYILIQEEIRSD